MLCFWVGEALFSVPSTQAVAELSLAMLCFWVGEAFFLPQSVWLKIELEGTSNLPRFMKEGT